MSTSLHPSPKAVVALAVALVTAMIFAAGCTAERGPAPYLTVVTRDDPQSLVLAHIYAAVIKGTGIDTKVRASADPVAELDAGIASIAPGFTGRLLRQLAPQLKLSGDEETTYRMMIAALPAGVAAGDYGTAEDRAALAVTSTAAQMLSEPALPALARHCDVLARSGTVGPARLHVPRVGPCVVGPVREFSSKEDLFAALRRGEIAAMWTSTADPALPADGIVVLDDEKDWLPANNVVPVYRRNELSEPQVLSLNKVAGELTTADLSEMTRRVGDGADPGEIVSIWLNDHQILLR